jgi:hypothetical protein
MKKLFLILSVIAFAITSSSAHHKLLKAPSKSLKSAQADDTGMLQALLDKGGIINLPAGKSFTTTRTLYLKSNSEIIYGNLCTINYTGSDAAIDFLRVGGKNYPVRITISDLSINLTSPGAVGIRWQCSSSSLKNCGVSLKTNNEIGFQLCGDVNGSGSYYNLFENCFVQGSRQIGSSGQYGWKFTYDQSTPSRCPNSNVWVGGRVGQCDFGMYINGNGNVVEHIATEGCGVSFFFDNPDSKVGCVSNKVLYPYIESCKTGFRFGANSTGCIASKPYATSTPSMKEDAGNRDEYTQ